MSAVPFHMWTPDAYEGAPTPATTFMAVAVKSAAFAVLLRVLLVGFGDERLMSWGTGWPPALALLGGADDDGRQRRRRPPGVGQAHARVLVDRARRLRAGRRGRDDALGQTGEASVLFYLLAYTVSTAGAFGALILCGRRGAEAVSYEDLAGIGKRHPAAALAFSLFLLSLAGVPPTAGFFGKLYVFRAAIDAELYALAVIGLLNSIVGAYYYLRVMVLHVHARAGAGRARSPRRCARATSRRGLLIAAVLVLLLGILPGMSLDVALAAGLKRG